MMNPNQPQQPPIPQNNPFAAVPNNTYIDGGQQQGPFQQNNQNGYYQTPGMVGSQGGQSYANQTYSPQTQGGIQDMWGQYQQNLQNAPKTAQNYQGIQQPNLLSMYQQSGIKPPDTAQGWANFQPNQLQGNWNNAQFGSAQGLYGGMNTPGLAGQYKDFLNKAPEQEQMEFNKAMERVRGAENTGRGQLDSLMGARQGGAGAGAYQQGVQDINRNVIQGTKDIASQQAFMNIADQQNRMQNYLGYQQQGFGNQMNLQGARVGAMGQDQQTQLAQLQGQTQAGNLDNQSAMARLQGLGGAQNQDFQNQQGWLGNMVGAAQSDYSNQMGYAGQLSGAQVEDFNQMRGATGDYGGWVGNMIGFDQGNAQAAQSQANAANSYGLRAGQIENDENYRRRQEAMGWLNQMQGYDQQQAGNYYQGQGQWLGYNQNRGNAGLGQYGPQWVYGG